MVTSAGDSALIVVDPQKAFVDPGGSLACTYGPDEIQPNVHALARLIAMLTRLRDAGCPVTLVRSEYHAGQFSNGLDTPLTHLCVPGANVDCEWADGLDVTAADAVLTKRTEDAFASEACRAHLRTLVEDGVRVLYFAGFQLTTCVKAAALSSQAEFGTGVRTVILLPVTGARASSYLAPPGSRSRVERTCDELVAAGVELAASPFLLPLTP
jgi:nicotinamidase-related amidase